MVQADEPRPLPRAEDHSESASADSAAPRASRADDVVRAHWSKRLEALLERAHGWFLALAPSALAGAGLGIALWLALSFEQRSYFASNDLPAPERARAALFPFCAGLGALLVRAVIEYRTPSAGDRAVFAARLRPLIWLACALPFVAVHTAPGMEASAPALLLLWSLVAAVMVGAAVYSAQRSWWRPPLASGASRLRSGLAWGALGLAVLGYAVHLSLASIAIHRALKSHLDLAVYDNILWNMSRGRLTTCTMCEGGTHASSHFDPLLVVFAPIYRLHPAPETLLCIQSLWLAAGAVPLFLLARDKLGSTGFALVIAACYLLYPPLHGANLFGFHSLVLSAPLLLGAVYFFERGRLGAYWVAIALLLLVREDMPLVVAGLALYVWVAKRRTLALFTLLAAGVYLLLVKLFFMADSGLIMDASNSSVSFASYFKQLIPDADGGTRELLVSLISNPVYALKVALAADKLRYALLLLVPLVFLPLFGGSRLWLGLWGFAFVALASRDAVYSPHFQYSTLLIPALFVALIEGIFRVSERARDESGRHIALRTAAVAACLVASLLVSAKFGAFIKNKALRGGWETPVWSMNVAGSDRYRDVMELVRLIPEEASVAATRGLLPYVSNRGNATKSMGQAEYVLVDKSNIDEKRAATLSKAKKAWVYELVDSRGSITLERRLVPRIRDSGAK
jgi:uncharacterized membrane protein